MKIRKLLVSMLFLICYESVFTEEIKNFIDIQFGTSREEFIKQVKNQGFDVYDDFPQKTVDCEKFNFDFLGIKCWHFVAYFENEKFNHYYLESDSVKSDNEAVRKIVQEVSTKYLMSFKEFSTKSKLSEDDVKSYFTLDEKGHYIEITKISSKSNIFIYGGLKKDYPISAEMKLVGEIKPDNELSGTYLDYNDMSSGWVCTIFEGSIFDVYKKDLENYNTDLKKQIFLDSEPSKKYLDDLKKIKKHLQTNGISYTLRSNWDDCSISTYDLQKKCFHITFGSNLSLSGTDGIGLKQVVAGFYVQKLPISVEVNQTMKELFGSSEYVSYVYDWKVSDLNKALKIEENLENIKLRIKLTVSGITSMKGDGFANNKRYTITRKIPVANSFEIEFFDSKTNEIYDSIKY